MNDHERRSVKTLGSLLTSKPQEKPVAAATCPVCGAEVFQQKCKVICRSESCIHRIIYNCSEF
ncbi:MAG: hypothetical protein ACAI44_09155 [Candidatus Sericytochromatia bacterium]